MLLESLINKSIKLYKQHDIGIFHKKPLPINFSGLNKQGNKMKVKEGWVASKSTTDYYGIYKGTFVAFEAKSTKEKSLPLANIKNHQWDYLQKISAHGGIAFFLISYSTYDEYFLITLDVFDKVLQKSLSINIARKYGFKLDLVYPGFLDFAPILDELN